VKIGTALFAIACIMLGVLAASGDLVELFR
jgi:hypothetical protein